jgi:hypothetical protein
MDRPAGFEGCATIIWPAPRRPGTPEGNQSAIPGWSVRIRDSLTGGPIETVVRFDLHADASDLIWAEFQMFTDQKGKPVLKDPVPMFVDYHDGSVTPQIGTFNWLITGMEVEPVVSSAKEVNDGAAEEPGPEQATLF